MNNRICKSVILTIFFFCCAGILFAQQIAFPLPRAGVNILLVEEAARYMKLPI